MILFIFSLFFFQFSNTYLSEPPKKINKLEGFRTEKSMSSQENWDKAQILLGHYFKRNAKFLLPLGLIIFLLEIISFIFWRTCIIWLLILECAIFFTCCFNLKVSVDSKLE